MSKLRITGGNPEALAVGCEEDSRARSWCPALIMGATRKQSTCYPMASGSSWSTLSKSLKDCWCATKLTALRLLTSSLLEPQSLWKEQPRVHQSHQPQCQAAQRRKWRDSLCTHCICVNKTIKLQKVTKLILVIKKYILGEILWVCSNHVSLLSSINESVS